MRFLRIQVRQEEDFLQEIFTVLRRSRHPAGQAEDARRVLPVERFERVDPGFTLAHRHLFRRERDWRALLRVGHVGEYWGKQA